MRSWSGRLFWSLCLVVIAQAWWRYDAMPSRVATHFDLQGRANGWMSREADTMTEVGLVLGFAAVMQLLSWSIGRLPTELINVPYREYWFAPERRTASLAWLREMVRLLGSGLFIMLGLLFDQVYRANLRATPVLSSAWWLVSGTTLVVIGVVVFATWRQFSRPPKPN